MVGRRILSVSQVDRLLHRLALEVMERHYGEALPTFIPASERGAAILRRLTHFLQQEGAPLPPAEAPPHSLLLVDDVLHTGTTLLHKLLAVSAETVPNRIEVLVLVDRGHRRYPIYPDYVGLRLATTLQEYVRVREVQEGWEVWLE